MDKTIKYRSLADKMVFNDSSIECKMESFKSEYNKLTDKEYSDVEREFQLQFLQFQMEEFNVYGSKVRYSKDIFDKKRMTNWQDLLESLIFKHMGTVGFVPVSSVMSQFITYCTSEQCNPNLKLETYEAIKFLQNNIKNVDVKIERLHSNSVDYNKRPLLFKLTDEDLSRISFNLPMVYHPLDWKLSSNNSNGVGGGYLHNKNEVISLKHSRVHFAGEGVKLSQDIINVVNELQRQTYSITPLNEAYEDHLNKYRKDLRTKYNMKKNIQGDPVK
jgi:hypothetical protein